MLGGGERQLQGGWLQSGENLLNDEGIQARPRQVLASRFAVVRPALHTFIRVQPRTPVIIMDVEPTATAGADHQTAKRPQFVKGAEDEPDDLLHLFIRVELDVSGGTPDVANRQRKLQLAPLGFAQAALVHALLQDMQFGFRYGAL